MDFIPSNLPEENKYPKLVRDNIPDIIKMQTGEDIQQKTLASDGEFLEYLLRKLVEEASEAHHSLVKNNLAEELADLLELIETIMELKKLPLSDILIVQNEKRHKNGGFKKRILMLKNVR